MRIQTRFVKGILIPEENPIWPLPPEILIPQHYWPFWYMQNYSDHGSVGGLDMTAMGTGNSFGAGGLLLDGNGWANYGSNNADITDVGATFSLLVEFTVISDAGGVLQTYGRFQNDNGAWSYGLLYTERGVWVKTCDGATRPDVSTGAYILTYGVSYQIIYTQSGGVGIIYKDGVLVSTTGTPVTPQATIDTPGIGIGATNASYGQNKMPAGTVIKRVAVLKGTAWTLANVEAIYAAFNP